MSQTTSTPKLLALLYTDVVGSMHLKTQIGQPNYLRLLQRHDELFRQALRDAAPDGTLQVDTGDGYLASFPTVTAAVNCALAFQHLIGNEPWTPVAITVRIGVHLGEAMQVGDKILGLAVDMSSRVMSLAMPGQILMTRFAFNEARQFVDRHPLDAGLTLSWMDHGAYEVKGVNEPVEIFEVGVVGVSQLKRPPGSEKVKPPHDTVLGWRPGVGLDVPGRPGVGSGTKTGRRRIR